jgi:hypothetical protein
MGAAQEISTDLLTTSSIRSDSPNRCRLTFHLLGDGRSASPSIRIFANTEDGQNTQVQETARSSKEVTAMHGVHLKDIKDELRSEPTWAWLYAAFLVGIVVFALLSGGFMN